MNIVSIEKISKSYGDKILFSDLSFGIEEGRKVGLIARNGSGKSTLMKIIAGKDTYDSGNISYRTGLHIGYLDQQPAFDPGQTVLQAALEIANPFTRQGEIVEAIRDYEKLMLTHEHGEKLHTAIARMDQLDAWNYESRMKQVLGKLNLHNLDQQVSQLSGGQIKRLALAHVLIEEPDLFLLDEPTNHLDIEMVEWLEDYLRRSTASLLMITHDRYFLDNICNELIELDYGKMYFYEGNYSYFLEKKEEREQNVQSELSKTRNVYRTELEWMRRQPKARGTKQKARIDSFEKIEDKLQGIRKEKELNLDIKMNRIGGKVLEFKKVYKSYKSDGEEKIILKGFDYTFKTGERIGIVGSNGTGKSTFLNIITGREEADSGKVNVGETVEFGYYSQQGITLKEDRRIGELLKEIADVITLADGSKVSASQFLNIFQFPPSMHMTPVSKLSGGEKRRLFLLTVLMKNPNFLILDEPTNDLDLLTLNKLEEFLVNFKGCLIVVSHDRYFLDKLADHLFIFEGNGVIKDFNGSYGEWRSMETKTAKDEAKLSKPEPRVKTQVKKLSYKESMELEKLEKEISDLESEKTSLAENLSSAAGNHQQILEWSSRYQQVEAELNKKSDRWLELSEKL